MAQFSDRTAMGGSMSAFPSTRWTQIASAKITNEERQRLIVNELFKAYWRPVYCYLRRIRYDNEAAKDLTQGFFYEVVMRRSLIQKADQEKGRFRTLLLRSLDRYLVDVRRGKMASKRRPRGGLFQLDDLDLPQMPTVEMTPEQDFNYAWTSDLLERVLSEVEEELKGSNKELHWQIFNDKVLAPILEDADPPSLKEICNKYGIESERKASNMLITVKRRLRKALERRLKSMLHKSQDLDDEIYELMATFSGSCAG